jgi:hypothetical protein
MADSAIKERDPIAGLTSILDLYNGKTSVTTDSPTTTTTTDASNMTTAQMQSQIDAAMAPLNQASHGAGLSTYSDTNLALGRAQVAADIAAKNAGSTRTTVTSGGSRTTSQPGPLSSSRIGSTLGSLALTQVGAPLLKKLSKSVTDPLSDSINKGLDSAISSVGDMFSGGAGNVIDSGGTNLFSDAASNYLAESATDSLGASAADAFLGDAGSSIASSAVSDAATSAGGSSVWDDVASFFGFANGGTVRKTPGYAAGGFVDRNVDRSILDSAVIPQANLTASGEIGPRTVSDTAANSMMQAITGSGYGDNRAAVQGQDGTRYASSLKQDLTDAGVANLAISAIGMMGPMGAVASNVISRLTDTPSLSALAMNSASNLNTRTDSLDAFLALNDNFGTTGGSGAGNTNSSIGPGGSSGEAGAAAGGASAAGPGVASGGNIRGPGTGTSDSIPTRLSDGETVITAQTTAKVKQVLGDDFFHNLERMFNAPAAATQVAQGRN